MPNKMTIHELKQYIRDGNATASSVPVAFFELDDLKLVRCNEEIYTEHDHEYWDIKEAIEGWS